MHEDELVITDAVARALVDEQFPRWRGLPLAPYPSTGTVNRLYRLGSTLAVRFPLLGTEARAARTELEAEAQAARELQGRTPFATPEPVALGEPGQGFPMPWTVQSWVAGRSAFEEDPGHSVDFARDLATFVSAVRAWALEQALGAARYYETSNPSMSMMGQRTVGRMLTADVGA